MQQQGLGMQGIQGRAPGGMPSIQALEASLGQAANQLYDGILDLNTPAPQLCHGWDQLLDLRDSLLRAYGVPVQPRTAGAQNFAAEQEGDAQVVDWKSKLLSLVTKRAGRSLTKGELAYEVGEQAGGYISTCSSQLLAHQYTGEVTTSKRLAEHAAAKATIAAEFPQEYQLAGGAPAAPGQMAGAARMHGMQWAAPGQAHVAALNQAAVGKKRPMEDSDAKTRLIHAIQLIMGRSVVKGDMLFETKALDEGSPQTPYISVLSLPSYEQAKLWTGEPGDSKKQAEMNVCAQVLEDLQEITAAAEEKHTAKKAKVRKEKASQKANNKEPFPTRLP